MPRLSDGGQKVPAVPALESSGYSYLVRMIKPNLILSHDWHVQPICQRSLQLIRLSGPFGSRPGLLPPSVLELVALTEIALFRTYRRFCANLLKLSDFRLRVKLNLLRPGPLKLVVGGSFPGCEFDQPGRERPVQKCRTAQNIKERPAISARADRARRSQNSWVLHWLVLCGIPYRGSGATASPDPTNQLIDPASHFPLGAGR